MNTVRSGLDQYSSAIYQAHYFWEEAVSVFSGGGPHWCQLFSWGKQFKDSGVSWVRWIKDDFACTPLGPGGVQLISGEKFFSAERMIICSFWVFCLLLHCIRQWWMMWGGLYNGSVELDQHSQAEFLQLPQEERNLLGLLCYGASVDVPFNVQKLNSQWYCRPLIQNCVEATFAAASTLLWKPLQALNTWILTDWFSQAPSDWRGLASSVWCSPDHVLGVLPKNQFAYALWVL